MEEEVVKFWESIQKMMKGQDKTILAGTVSEVNEQERTCSLKVDDVTYEDVRLYGLVKAELKGFCFIPKKDSYVLACRIEGSNSLFVTMFTEVDKILLTMGDKVNVAIDATTLSYQNNEVKLSVTGSKVELSATDIVINGGGLGGLVKVKELTAKINALEKEINNLKKAFSSWVPVAMDGGAALKAAVTGWIKKKIKLTKQADYENTKVKH